MGNATVLGTNFRMGKDYIGSTVHILYDDAEILFFDSRGAEIISHPRPPKGTRYVGNGKPAGIMADPSAAVRKRKVRPVKAAAKDAKPPSPNSKCLQTSETTTVNGDMRHELSTRT